MPFLYFNFSVQTPEKKISIITILSEIMFNLRSKVETLSSNHLGLADLLNSTLLDRDHKVREEKRERRGSDKTEKKRKKRRELKED